MDEDKKTEPATSCPPSMEKRTSLACSLPPWKVRVSWKENKSLWKYNWVKKKKKNKKKKKTKQKPTKGKKTKGKKKGNKKKKKKEKKKKRKKNY